MGPPPCVIYWLDDARGQGSGSPCVIYFFALRHLFFRPASSTLSLCVFGTAQRVLSTKHNVCFPQSTMCAFHKAQCVLSTKHNVCFPQSTMCAFHKTQFVLSTKHNACFPQSTMCAFHQAQCVLATKHNGENTLIPSACVIYFVDDATPLRHLKVPRVI